MQDYKCLCAAVTICSILDNIRTHNRTYTQTAFDHKLNSSASYT